MGNATNKTPGTLREILRTPNKATPLPSPARNAAQPVTPETRKLSGERYKQTLGTLRETVGTSNNAMPLIVMPGTLHSP